MLLPEGAVNWNDISGDTMKRPPSEPEKNIIRRVAERLSSGESRLLLDDLEKSEAEPVGASSARIVFHISGYERPPYRGQRSFGVGGDLLDKDGTKLSFDLFADENGHLLELELIRWGEGDLIEPNWSTVKFY